MSDTRIIKGPGGKASMKLVGFGDLYKKLRRIAPDSLEAGRKVLNEHVEEVLRQSQKLVPVKTGALKASGQVIKARSARKGERLTAAVAYGDRKTWYATLVHEDLAAKHEQGEAKFLEKPAVASKPRLLKKLGDAIMAKLSKLK